MSQTPPVAKREPLRTEQLGRVRTDDYAWMKDDNWQAVMRDPALLRADIRQHLQAENAYTEALLAPTKALQEALFGEMRGRIKEDDASVPEPDGAFEYYARYVTGGQHPVYARRPRGGGVEDVLLDVDALAAGHAFFQVSEAEHSPDHALFAYAADDQGSEYYRIHLKDLATGQTLAGPVESATGSFAFSPDSQWLFWVWRDENGRSAKVFRRPARGAGGSDVLVYEEPDGGMFLSVGLTASRAFIVISSGDHETSESRLVPAADPTAEPLVVEPRQVGLRYSLEHWDGRFVVLTNADDAVDYKLMWADEDAPGRSSWRDFVPHQPGRFITGLVATRDHLARLERVDAVNQIVVTERGTWGEHAVAFDEEAYGLSLDGGHEYDTTTMRFVYQSPTTPKQWFDYDMATRQRTLRKTQAIPSGHDPSAYLARRLYATAPDGAVVPITVTMRKDTPLDGSAPMLLYGYGAYGMPMEPHFSIRTLSLVDRGWIHAVAHIRGGTEKGWGWFLDGRKDKKPNSFTDFIACAEALVAAGYGAAGRIVAEGRSAGGMLMGAVTNLRPDLWAGIIGGVPFVDVLNTMSDASLPLTPPEWPEWGDPLTDRAAYDLIAGYSPYDNVTAQAYPAVLATGGLSDARVTYWEPSKWVATLRAHTTGTAPILLKMNMDAGHGGAAGRFDFLKEIAFDYAFAIWAIERGWEGKDQACDYTIRPAKAGDAEAIAAIYAHHVLHGLGTFEEVPPSPADILERMRDVESRGLPWRVAEAPDGAVLGYAYAGAFRTRAAYRFTAETSIYVVDGHQGQGLGRALLASVIEACEAAGVRQLLAVIGGSENAGSIALHAAFGFKHIGVLSKVGFKAGRWVDVVMMQKALGGTS